MPQKKPVPKPVGKPARSKACPNCGGRVAPGGRGTGRIFCQKKPGQNSPSCRAEFHARSKSRATIVPLVLAWLETRHAKDPAGQAICRAARRELTQIGRLFLGQDKEKGRPRARDYVRNLLWSDGEPREFPDQAYFDRVRGDSADIDRASLTPLDA